MDAIQAKSIFQTVYNCVGPVRSAAYEALFFLAEEENLTGYRDGKIRELPGQKTFDETIEMMDHGLDDLLVEVKDRLSDNLVVRRSAAREQIGAFYRSLFEYSNHDAITQDSIRECAASIQTQLRPIVTEFLMELDEFCDSVKREEETNNRAIIDGAITDIENINSTINLIAVNASVEAALAGDAGRGFAVIASEIQDLSQKSKKVVEDFRNSLG